MTFAWEEILGLFAIGFRILAVFDVNVDDVFTDILIKLPSVLPGLWLIL